MDDPAESEVRAALADAEEYGHGVKTEPLPGQARLIAGKPVKPGGWIADGLADEWGMPPDCPVTPLGTDELRFFFLTTNGQVVSVPDLKAETIKKLFAGRMHYLYWAWPRWKKPNDPDEVFTCDGWDANKAADALYDACSHKGVWRDFDRIRGRGMWRDDDGGLVVHCGDVLFARDPKGKLSVRPPGDYTTDYGGAVYPAGARVPYPWREPVGTGVGREVLEILGAWNWRRPIDAQLLLGWLICSIMAGALDWRPSCYVTGLSGSGKSTLLNRTLKALLGSRAVYATNVTAASLYQHIKQDSPSMIIDQFEAGSNPARAKAVIELVRDASSEGLTLRGGADGKGFAFSARNCTMFSSVRRPAMRPEDLSRTAFLQLDKLTAANQLPDLSPARLHELGRKLVRRVLDRWDDHFDTLNAWHTALMAVGHTSRSADQFGGLLAAADLVLADALPHADELTVVSAELAPDGMVELEGQVDDWERCLNHMLSAPVNAWRSGMQSSVGRLLDQFLEAIADKNKHQDVFSATTDAGILTQANNLLSAAGLKIETAKRDLPGVTWWLSVPSSDEKLRALFEDSDFAGESAVEGAWAGSLQQAPRFDPDTRKGLWVSRRSRLDGRQRRCTWLDLGQVVTREEFEDAPPVETPAAEDGRDEIPF